MAEEHQQNYGQFAQAKLLFAQGNYNDCMPLLAQVEFNDIFLNMNAKSMLLKMYYEKKYIDAFEAFCQSFRRFLQRKSIVAYQRKIYENLISLSIKILHTPQHEQVKLIALKEEINQTEPLTEKPWLLAQLAKKLKN